MTGASTAVLAANWTLHDTDAGVPMVMGMIVFWVAAIALVAWLVRGGAQPGGAQPRSQTPEEVLRHRLAEGAISVEEYEQRRTALLGRPTDRSAESSPPPGPDAPASS